MKLIPEQLVAFRKSLKVKVVSIVTDENDFMKPIRSVLKKRRRCKRSYHEEQLIEDKGVLDLLYALTSSQLELLRKEANLLNPRIREDRIRLN